VLEITVGHRPFSDQFQYLTDQNSFCSDKFTVHFQWEAINIPVKSNNLLQTSDQFLNLISGPVCVSIPAQEQVCLVLKCATT